MDITYVITSLIVGFALGLFTAWVFKFLNNRSGKELVNDLLKKSEQQQQQYVDTILSTIRTNFGDLSLDALSKVTDQLTDKAKTHLTSQLEISSKDIDGKKEVINSEMKRMNDELNKVTGLVKELEKDRESKFGELAEQLRTTNSQTSSLISTTTKLEKVLASSQSRGQWGERIAEDILQLAGFIENVSYTKQKAIENIGTKPDFTFLLPRDLKLNMDVKFPIANYTRYIEAESETEKDQAKKDFLSDVKARVKEVSTRDYINAEQNTVDCVLLFIPHEQIFAFIQANGSQILDDALKNKVISCSPMTLFAVLAVIRQSIDNFSLEQTSSEILTLLGDFNKQWKLYTEKFVKLGRGIDSIRTEYETLQTTRARQLEKPLTKIEQLRQRCASEAETPALTE